MPDYSIHIETPRLILREIQPGDEIPFFEMDSNPEVHRYLGNNPVKTIEDTRESIARIRQQYIDFGIGRWAMIEKETGAFTGWTGLKWVTDPANGYNEYPDIGYRIKPEFWGKGYATESSIAARDYAFNVLKYPVLYGTAHIDNIASQTVLKKIGLSFVNIYERNDMKIHWYELPREKWETLK